MKHILLAPDSFKGTMSASEICIIQKEVIERLLPGAVVRTLPMADGGEGFTRSYLQACGGRLVETWVTGPLHTPVRGFYGLLPDGSAVIEMAAAAGLPLMGKKRDPLRATTYGVGELIRHAASQGAGRILLGLGGSATNDCGIGMAAALGYRFYDAAGNPVPPLAEHLGHICSIGCEEALSIPPVLAACDVDNPLCGSEGATAIFGPQKGVTKETFPLLEEGMRHLAQLMEQTHRPIAEVPGAGAAGGLGAGVLFFLEGRLCSGLDMLLDAAGFDSFLAQSDLVITGEGCMDAQSVHGKVPAGVGRRCKAKGVPCIALCGALGDGAEALYDHGISAMFSAIHRFTDLESSLAVCREDLRLLTEAVIRLLSLVPSSRLS